MSPQLDTAHVIQVLDEQAGMRIDQFLSQHFVTYSRTFFQKLIDDKMVTVNGKIVEKPSLPVKAGDTISVTFPSPVPLATAKEIPADLQVPIIHEHDEFLIIEKPPYLMVHAPRQETKAFTLVDWLITNISDIAKVGIPERPGIVHRLDKDTSGLLIIPRTNRAHMYFGNLFKDRKITKIYLALVKGHPPAEGIIDAPIARHPIYKHKMATGISGRHALTYYKVLEYLKDSSLVEIKPVTGRTHQIRVHMASIGHPVIGDALYGSISSHIARQALHAAQLEFTFDGKLFRFSREMPEDMAQALAALKERKA